MIDLLDIRNSAFKLCLVHHLAPTGIAGSQVVAEFFVEGDHEEVATDGN